MNNYEIQRTFGSERLIWLNQRVACRSTTSVKKILKAIMRSILIIVFHNWKLMQALVSNSVIGSKLSSVSMRRSPPLLAYQMPAKVIALVRWIAINLSSLISTKFRLKKIFQQDSSSIDTKLGKHFNSLHKAKRTLLICFVSFKF